MTLRQVFLPKCVTTQEWLNQVKNIHTTDYDTVNKNHFYKKLLIIWRKANEVTKVRYKLFFRVPSQTVFNKAHRKKNPQISSNW